MPAEAQKIHSETTFDDVPGRATGEPPMMPDDEMSLGRNRVIAAGVLGTAGLAMALAVALVMAAGLVWLGPDPLQGAAALLP